MFNKPAEGKISNGTIVIRDPEMLIRGKDDVVINLRNRENGLKEAGFRCHLYDLAPLLPDKEMHISQVKPVVTKKGQLILYITWICSHVALLLTRMSQSISKNVTIGAEAINS